MEKINFNENLFKKIKAHDGLIHLVLIATKPDIIKQAPLVLELKKRNEFVLVVHSGNIMTGIFQVAGSRIRF